MNDKFRNTRQEYIDHPTFFEVTFSLIADGVCVFDREHSIVYFNRQMQRLVGINNEAPFNVSSLNLPPELARQLTESTDAVLQGGEPVEDLNFYLADRNTHLSFNLSPLPAADGALNLVACVARDLTEKVALLESKERQQFLLRLSDALRLLQDPVAIQETTTMLLGEHLKVDRTYYAWIDEERQIATIERDYVRDESPSLAGEHRLEDFRAIVKAFNAGKLFIANDVVQMPEAREQLENFLSIKLRAVLCTPLIRGGKLAATMALTNSSARQWTENEILLLEETAQRTWAAVERARAEESLRISEERFRSFVAASSDLVYRISADWQEMYVLSGKNLRTHQDGSNDGWIDRHFPQDEQQEVWQKINEAISKKKAVEIEHRVVKDDGTPGWTFSRAVPLLDDHGNISEWLGTSTDITARKIAEQQLEDLTNRLEQEVTEQTAALKENRDQLQSIFDTTLMQIAILEAVRDQAGEVKDLIFKLVNKELERETGRTDLQGKLFLEVYPGVRDSGLFDLMVDTIQTGKPQQAEYFYPFEGFNKWFSCMFVKLNDGVVAVNMDITSRKKAEEERFKNYLLLQQSEDVASLGTWDFDPLNATFIWSDGMYRLFNLENGTEVTPDIYLQYSTAAGRPAAENVIKNLTRTPSDFTETLELEIAGKIKIIQVKATVVRNREGQPVRILGVDVDITASQQAEEKIRKMQAEQQQEIFRVTLASQEEERRRISESLHNGLGQLLYAIKISMAHLTERQAVSKPEAFMEAKRYTEKLLMDSIAECRRISHELMPSILEEFGLKAAVQDVCQQLSKGIRFKCAIKEPYRRIDSYMQLAVFRTVQELMLNVVKHSQATEARTEISVDESQVFICVQDNGRGMAMPNENEGIGLASIRSKVELLNGQVRISPRSSSGTTVTVTIPLSPAS